MCAKRLQLLKEYRETLVIYAEFTRLTADLMENTSLDPRARILRRAGQLSWKAVAKYRVAISQHEADHCCGSHAVPSVEPNRRY
jgi:hypothetical protein